MTVSACNIPLSSSWPIVKSRPLGPPGQTLGRLSRTNDSCECYTAFTLNSRLNAGLSNVDRTNWLFHIASRHMTNLLLRGAGLFFFPRLLTGCPAPESRWDRRYQQRAQIIEQDIEGNLSFSYSKPPRVTAGNKAIITFSERHNESRWSEITWDFGAVWKGL